MKKEEYIEKRGKEAYERKLEQDRKRMRRWQVANPEQVKAKNNEINRVGGKYYARKLEYCGTGLQGERNRIRAIHRKQYRLFKKIIAPESQIHHEWILETADYNGIALVEADQHIYGFIDVIHVLDGEITLFREIIGGTKQ